MTAIGVLILVTQIFYLLLVIPKEDTEVCEINLNPCHAEIILDNIFKRKSWRGFLVLEDLETIKRADK